jgi:hypothetical protein
VGQRRPIATEKGRGYLLGREVAEVDGNAMGPFFGPFYKPTITILLAPLVWRIAGTSLLQ